MSVTVRNLVGGAPRRWAPPMWAGGPRGAVSLAVRALLVAVAVAAAAYVHLPGRPATLCLLRALTGVPCPFCGGTTAAVHLGHGDIGGALHASPLAVGMLIAAPAVGVGRRPRWWSNRRLRRGAILVLLGASELWQLNRFGILAGAA